MTMAWLRLYDGILDDPKIQMLSDRAFRMLINLWCLAKRRGGTIPNDPTLLSFALRMPTGKIRDTLQALISGRLIEEIDGGYRPHDWDQHQYDGDVTAAERMRRYRKRNGHRNGDGDLLRHSDVLEPDTEPDTENISQSFDQFWDAFPRRVAKGAAIKAFAKAVKRAEPSVIIAAAKRYALSRKKEDPAFTKHPATWLNSDSWLDEDGHVVETVDPVKAAAARDQADRLMRRGKYADQ